VQNTVYITERNNISHCDVTETVRFDDSASDRESFGFVAVDISKNMVDYSNTGLNIWYKNCGFY